MRESEAERRRLEELRRPHDEREQRLIELARVNPDIQWLLWQRDSARVRLNMISVAMGHHDLVPMPDHAWDLSLRIHHELQPRSPTEWFDRFYPTRDDAATEQCADAQSGD
jgi:hypothetical protein